MKVLLIGATGQLGTDLRVALKTAGVELVAPPRSELDVCSSERLRAAFDRYSPEVVINTSAFHKMDECEKLPQLAFEVNASAVKCLSEECERIGATLVHYSTDYVFGRQSTRNTPYLEEERTEPLNVYGVSKVAGEAMVQYITSRHYILRVCGLYGQAGSSGKGGNFVENMLKRAQEGSPLRVVHDQVLTPTSTRVVAGKTLELLRLGAYGVYHMTAEGQCSWYEFTMKIMECSGLARTVIPVGTDAFPSPVRRPQYSVLSKRKLASVGIQMPSWESALSDYIRSRELGDSAVSA